VIIIKVEIIGGGLAGLSTAISLKNLDKHIEVTVHEKYKEIGYNPEGRRCGEGHTVEANWKKWKPNKKSIYNHVTTVLTYVDHKTYTAKVSSGVGYILNRQEFIHQLGEQAKKTGVEIITGDKIQAENELNADYLIDASGCPSSIKKKLGIDKGIKGQSYQQTLEQSNSFLSDTLKVFFSDALGYYWIFPRDPTKMEINVGVGTLRTVKNIKLKHLLESFKESQHIAGIINYTTGGLVPTGLQRPLMYKNILFVGDTGVGAHPILGKGIYRALYSGEIAANCIAKGCPEKYPKIITQEFIKWDLIGKNYIRISQLMSKISRKALRFFYRSYLDAWYSFH
jgi:flavin-dependent dehydrogenase